jgi:hypothetical protein
VSLQIRLRRCPACRSALLGDAGRAFLVCPDCPTALAFGSAEPVPTFRPRPEETAGDSRLAFWLFRSESFRAPLWVAAYRCFNQPARPDLDVLLTERRHEPALAPAPLGALLARGPEEAAAIQSARWGKVTAAEPPRLVSLAVLREGDLLREPITGWSVLAKLVRPLLRSG